MKIKPWIKAILIGGSILTLAACSSAHKSRYSAEVNDANAAYGAQSSGLGDESTFGDRAGGKQLAKRVYYFDYDSNVVRTDDRSSIVANGNYLNSHSNVKAIVEGNTDPRGSREYNIGLGERRAKAVAQILADSGVNPGQLRLVSYGAEKLASNGHTEADYQQDRRVVIVYMQR